VGYSKDGRRRVKPLYPSMSNPSREDRRWSCCTVVIYRKRYKRSFLELVGILHKLEIASFPEKCNLFLGEFDGYGMIRSA
jgi:hypothetical protein